MNRHRVVLGPIAWVALCLLFATLWPGVRAGEAEKPAPQNEERPVTIAVRDAETGKAIQRFEYHYLITSPGRAQIDTRDSWQEHSSPDGTLVIDRAPPECEIDIDFRASGYVGEYGMETWRHIELKADDPNRRIEVKLQRAARVKGIVKDHNTGQPVAGASVAPLALRMPSFDLRRVGSLAVTSDESGAFELLLVPGKKFAIDRAGYQPESFDFPADPSKQQTYLLTPLDRTAIRGRVETAQGEPLGGVTVSERGGKTTQTGADGSFEMEAVILAGRRVPYELAFSKPGYFPSKWEAKIPPREPISVRLKRAYRLRLEVVDAGGNPVRQFKVHYGPGPSPETFQCTTREVEAPQGRATLILGEGQPNEDEWIPKYLREAKEVWLAVEARGQPFWDHVFPVGKLDVTHRVELPPAHVVTGSVKFPRSDAGLTAALVPQRGRRGVDQEHFSGVEEFGAAVYGRREVAVGADGSFRFEQVAPRVYTLEIDGEHLPTLRRLVVVEHEDLALDPMKMPGTGRIAGQVFSPMGAREGGRQPWASASGSIRFPSWTESTRAICFTTDEQGRFSIGDVAAVKTAVSISYAISIDAGGAYTRDAWVVPGKTTEVRFFDPQEKWNLPFEFEIGDGSERAYCAGAAVTPAELAQREKQYWMDERDPRRALLTVHLTPGGARPASYPGEGGWDNCFKITPGDQSIDVPDVHPGEYRVEVYDFGLPEGETPLWSGEIDASPGMKPIRVKLPAASLAGKVPGVEEDRYWGQLSTIDADNQQLVRMSPCALGRRFHVRFHKPGRFDFYLHDGVDRFSRLYVVPVIEGRVTELKFPEPVPGGTIAGRIVLHKEHRLPDAVVATDARGCSIRDPRFDGVLADGYKIAGLWPGEWTVRLQSGDEVLATAKATIRGKETVHRDLAGR